ncbi:DUF4127 family protein [Salinispira pacifica]|uniref:DUF4127 family protein n=1 Tax=Salinispira pacifica TaxID=1307761 RepID=V5WDS9_9SPIO|nr:DUF4127 family protein [Salinispira pacifica]AHC13963.1 hypothetical protein L21SP2_0531 [Salinispira pacifica]
MTVAYIPLDERPCNLHFPRHALSGNASVTLAVPPAYMFGKKKTAGDPDALLNWLEATIQDCDALVLSLEMILYGGLLPSRLHHMSYNDLSLHLEKVISLIRWRKEREGGGRFRVYAFGLVMRTPSYSSDDEEPDYYARFGREIFRRAYLSHKSETEELTEDETREYCSLDQIIPEEILNDYEGRRETNRRLLQDAIRYFSQGDIDVLLIPQDDTARYGYGPKDWSCLLSRIPPGDGPGSGNLLSYPGADEVGGVLIARSVMDGNNRNTGNDPRREKQKGIKMYVLPRLWEDMKRIPKYESMSLSESVRNQIQSCGAVEAGNPEDADIILAVNTPPAGMHEAPGQEFRESSEFAQQIARLSSRYSLPVIAADTAYPNGGETSLLQEFERQNLWNSLLSYAGWNTAGNSLGTALYEGVLAYLAGDAGIRMKNLYYRICDDWAYQSILRSTWTARLSERGTEGHVDITSIGNLPGLKSELRDQINELMESRFPQFTDMAGYRVSQVEFPWDRLFEVRLEIESAAASSSALLKQ